jgi:hypothetical protein
MRNDGEQIGVGPSVLTMRPLLRSEIVLSLLLIQCAGTVIVLLLSGGSITSFFRWIFTGSHWKTLVLDSFVKNTDLFYMMQSCKGWGSWFSLGMSDTDPRLFHKSSASSFAGFGVEFVSVETLFPVCVLSVFLSVVLAFVSLKDLESKLRGQSGRSNLRVYSALIPSSTCSSGGKSGVTRKYNISCIFSIGMSTWSSHCLRLPFLLLMHCTV